MEAPFTPTRHRDTETQRHTGSGSLCVAVLLWFVVETT